MPSVWPLGFEKNTPSGFIAFLLPARGWRLESHKVAMKKMHSGVAAPAA